MASIRKRGNSYLIVVSMGYTPDGRRRNPQQKTVKPPTGLTPKQTGKWLQEQAMLFEMSCKKLNPLAKSTLVREKQDIERFKPYLGSYKLVDLRPEHFRSLYAKLRKQTNKATGKPLSEATVEGVHSCLCGILSDAMEGGYLDHNPAWRTYKIATGMRRGECCALKWEDINYAERSIHVCRNAVKTTDDEIIVKAPKTKAGKRSSDRPERSQSAPHGGKPVHRQRHGCRHSCWIARTQSTVYHAGYLHPHHRRYAQ